MLSVTSQIQRRWAQHGGSAQIYNNLPEEEEEGEFKWDLLTGSQTHFVTEVQPLGVDFTGSVIVWDVLGKYIFSWAVLCAIEPEKNWDTSLWAQISEAFRWAKTPAYYLLLKIKQLLYIHKKGVLLKYNNPGVPLKNKHQDWDKSASKEFTFMYQKTKIWGKCTGLLFDSVSQLQTSSHTQRCWRRKNL